MMTSEAEKQDYEGEFAADAKRAREELAVLLGALGVQANVTLECALLCEYRAQTEKHDFAAARVRTALMSTAQAEARAALEKVARHLGVRL